MKRRRCELPRGADGGGGGSLEDTVAQEIFKIKHSETLVPAFPRQVWSSLKFLFLREIFNEIGQLDRGNCTGDPEWGMAVSP